MAADMKRDLLSSAATIPAPPAPAGNVCADLIAWCDRKITACDTVLDLLSKAERAQRRILETAKPGGTA
jgi:hypothetical protein